MNNRADQEDLLAKVFAEASPPDFRAALLGETLRLARGRRRWRHARRAGGVLAVVVLAALFALQNQPEKISMTQSVARTSIARNYQLVETQPLPASARIATENFLAVKIVSSAATVAQVATAVGGFRLINDGQLLALIGSKPAILIRTGPNSEELVFANPQDRKRFLEN